MEAACMCRLSREPAHTRDQPQARKQRGATRHAIGSADGAHPTRPKNTRPAGARYTIRKNRIQDMRRERLYNKTKEGKLSRTMVHGHDKARSGGRRIGTNRPRNEIRIARMQHRPAECCPCGQTRHARRGWDSVKPHTRERGGS